MNPEKESLYEAPLDGEWRKSSFSNGSSDHCVELMPIAEGVAIRDSKHPTHPEIRYTLPKFVTFLRAIKAGELDSLP